MNFNISICLLILKVLFLILYKHKLIILVVVPLVYKYKNKLYKTYFPKLYVLGSQSTPALQISWKFIITLPGSTVEI